MPQKQNRPVLLGVTGGIGSGKSVVCRIFECLGAPVYYADTRAKWLMTNDPELRSNIIEAFGEESYTREELNRSFLASNVFSNKEKLAKLNSLVHPAVAKDGKKWQQANHNETVLVKEAALLYETGSYKQLDYTVVVAADQELRIDRVLSRDPQRIREEVLSIIEKQIPQEEKIARADFVIYNNEEQSLIDQVYVFLKKIKLEL